MTHDWKQACSAVLSSCLVVLVSACATAPRIPRSDLPVLIDPRVGYEGLTSEPVDRKLEAAWKKLGAGDVAGAEKAFTNLATKYPRYAPATLARAVVALAKDQLDQAERYVEKIADPGSSYVAAEAYRAEIALARSLTEDAYRTYDRLAAMPDSPVVVMKRYEVVKDAWFEELIAKAAATEKTEDRIEFLSEAVSLRPRSDATRIELVRQYIVVGDFDAARAGVEILLDRGLAENPDVQAILADLEAADGRFQDAIIRLERLVRRYPGRGHEERLAEVKLDYMRANLPPRYHKAVASQAITRADLAVLAYWHVSVVRFSSVSEPPIAVDIAGAAGRDEIVKALGLGLLSVDRATRSVGPDWTITARTFLNATLRLMSLGSPPPCAEGLSGVDALAACGIDVEGILESPGAVSGARAVAVFNTIDDLFKSAE